MKSVCRCLGALAMATLGASNSVHAASVPLFSDGFNSGDTTAWVTTVPKSFLAVTVGAALEGSFGLEVTKDSTSNTFVQDDTPTTETAYRANFLLDINTLSLGVGDEVSIFNVLQSGGSAIAAVVLRGAGSGLELYALALDDSGAEQVTAATSIVTGSRRVELELVAASGAGANDGRLTLSVNGSAVGALTGLDTDTRAVDRVRLGGSGDAGTGTYYLDDFQSFRIVAPTISATLDADPATIPPGGASVDFEVTVTNTGEVDATVETANATVDGQAVNFGGACGLPRALAAAASFACGFDRSLAGTLGESLNASVTIAAVDSDDLPAQATDEVDILVAGPVVTSSLVDALVLDGGLAGVVDPGDEVAFTGTITNVGNRFATGLEFVAPAIENATLVVGSVTTTAGTVDVGNTGGDTSVSIDVGSLSGGGGEVIISYRVTVDAPLASGVASISSQGTVTGTGIDPVLTDDPDAGGTADATVVSVTASPALEVSLRDALVVDGGSEGVVERGDTLRFTLEITNVGNQDEAAVFAMQPAISDATVVAGSVTSSQGAVTAGNEGGAVDVTIELGSLPGGGGSATVTVDVLIDELAPEPVDRLTAQASVMGDNTPLTLSDDPDTAEPDDPTVTLLAAIPDQVALTVTKTDGLLAIGNGESIDYVIVVSNAGPDDARDVLVVDVVPAGIDNVTWLCDPADGAACGASGNGDLMDLADISVGSQVTYTLSGTVVAADGTILTNVVTVEAGDGAEEGELSDNVATDRTAVGERVFGDGFEPLPDGKGGRIPGQWKDRGPRTAPDRSH